MKTSKTWFLSWLIVTVVVLTAIGAYIYYVDPFFHFHYPHTDSFYYEIDNERGQNDGIVKHFEYDALITGTSMTENFKTSEVDRLFECNSIKVPFAGGTYKEINDCVETALRSNPECRLIIRGLDNEMINAGWDSMRTDMGAYPTFLYDGNPFNDVEYLLNTELTGLRVFRMTEEKYKDDYVPGVTSFDEYMNWGNDNISYGKEAAINNTNTYEESNMIEHLTDEDKKRIKENIEHNVTNIAESHPDVEFYYFYPPESILWWKNMKRSGQLYKVLEEKQYATELLLNRDNIHLFIFDNRTDITTDLDNYKDQAHYGPWINSRMLEWMKNGEDSVTEENADEYLHKMYDYYTTYDYDRI